MKASEIVVGGVYSAKVSNRIVPVCVEEISSANGSKRYIVRNMTTERRLVFRSAAKFRGVATLRQSAPIDLCGNEIKPDDPGYSDAVRLQKRAEKIESKCLDALEEYPTAAIAAAPLVASADESSLQGLVLEVLDKGPQHLDNIADHLGYSRSSIAVVLLNMEMAKRVRRLPGDRFEVREPDPLEPEEEGLAGDQPIAFRDIVSRLRGKQPTIKLVGYAGSGKTWLLARIAQWAKRNRYEVTVVAPTHKAAGVIQAKLNGLGVTVRTIHSMLGLRLEPDYENDTGGRILQAVDQKQKPKGLIICDEASMVGSVLKEHIDRTHNVQWLFVGDLAQLPPVGESLSELLSDPDSTLEQVLRQAQGSEILNLATGIRNGDMSMKFEEGRDVFRVDSAEDLFQRALESFDTDEYRADASYARMLVFKNVRRQAINLRMRQLLIGAEEPYMDGEWLVMYAQFSPEKSRLNVLAEHARKQTKGTRTSSTAWREFFNYKESLGTTVTQLHVSEEVLVQSAAEGRVNIGSWTFAVWKLGVKAREDEYFILPVLQSQEVQRAKEIMTGLANGAQEARKARDEFDEGSSQWLSYDADRKRAWSTYFSLEETFAQVDYAYAMTVHKSQGSTFQHAFVDVPDLMSSGGMQQRILYTAVTRPAKSLTFYN